MNWPDVVVDVTDVWTFERVLGSRDPNWKLVATEAGRMTRVPVPRPLGCAALSSVILTMATLTVALAEQARLEPVRFEELSGWQQDDHAAAFSTFRRSCEALVGVYAEFCAPH